MIMVMIIFIRHYSTRKKKSENTQHIQCGKEEKGKNKKNSPQVKPLVISNTYINIHIKINK